MEEKVAQPSWLWGQRVSCPLISPDTAGWQPALHMVFARTSRHKPRAEKSTLIIAERAEND